MSRWSRSLSFLAILAAAGMPASAANAGGIDFAWSRCAGDGGTPNRSFACDTDEGTHVLVGSFTLDQPIAGMMAAEAVVDLIVANSQLVPAWWEAFGECRLGSITADATIDPLASNCTDWSSGGAFGGLIGFDHSGTIAIADTASHRRLKVMCAMDLPGANVVANQEYFAFNLVIDNLGTTDPGSCAGCGLPACLVLNSFRFLNSSAQVTTLTWARTSGSNFATWQGGSGANCTSVPARRVTWGQVKALYN